MSEQPVRIQRKRTRGWKMPPNTVYIGRPTQWGNPWTVKAALESGLFLPEFVGQTCVAEYEAWLLGVDTPTCEHLGIWHELVGQHQWILDHIHELRGKNLACWCKPGEPCHADVLLKLANG